MTLDEIVDRIQSATPEKLEACAEALQTAAYRELAAGRPDCASESEEIAAMFRQLAEQRRG